MRRHRAPFLAVLSLAAACWLAAGPGGVVVRAVLACRHATMLMHHGHAGHAKTPAGGPCFCSQMVGGFDQALSVAMPAVVPSPATGVAVSMPAHTSPVPLPPSPTLTPPTPPPNTAA